MSEGGRVGGWVVSECMDVVRLKSMVLALFRGAGVVAGRLATPTPWKAVMRCWSWRPTKAVPRRPTFPRDLMGARGVFSGSGKVAEGREGIAASTSKSELEAEWSCSGSDSSPSYIPSERSSYTLVLRMVMMCGYAAV